MNEYYFDGDPAVDSTRRQLERVLQGRPRRRWPWIVAALAGGAAFGFWRMSRRAKEPHVATGASSVSPESIPQGR